MVITNPSVSCQPTQQLPNEIIDEILLNLKSITQDKDFIEEFGRLRFTNHQFNACILDTEDFSLRATKNIFLELAKQYKDQIKKEGISPEEAKFTLEKNTKTALEYFKHICLPISDIIRMGGRTQKKLF